MTSYDTAVDILQQAAAELRPPNEQDENNTWEDVSLLDAVGRVVAADITPLLLRVRGTIAAGDELTVLGEDVFQGDAAEPCLEIMTGGIFPVVSGSKRQTRFHGVAMRPGHPVLFAEVPGPSRIVPVFGLPGNPGAAAACFRFLVLPFLRSWSHQAAETPVMARCLDDLVINGHRGGGRKAASPGIPPTTSFRHGTLKQLPDGDMAVELSKQQSPAKLGPFIVANCWVRTGDHSQGTRPEAARVPCYSITSRAAF
ncbi:molybdopterin biosynthesis protein [Colletotrichum tabaci]|uniref:Molybdopterin biosynthesis protein n=1 Tax=Colletotrichum tabaci TaxID=1209068 RepID=A0AAV9T9S3_9PEZI